MAHFSDTHGSYPSCLPTPGVALHTSGIPLLSLWPLGVCFSSVSVCSLSNTGRPLSFEDESVVGFSPMWHLYSQQPVSCVYPASVYLIITCFSLTHAPGRLRSHHLPVHQGTGAPIPQRPCATGILSSCGMPVAVRRPISMLCSMSVSPWACG